MQMLVVFFVVFFLGGEVKVAYFLQDSSGFCYSVLKLMLEDSSYCLGEGQINEELLHLW